MTRRLVDRGGRSFDLHLAPGVIVELAKTQYGWDFWQLNIDGERFGSFCRVSPGFVDVLDAMLAGSAPEGPK